MNFEILLGLANVMIKSSYLLKNYYEFRVIQFQFQNLLSVSPLRNVFLFAYMRGGSTLLYELFNHDTRVLAWYEPLAPLYGHLYGMPQYRHYMDVVFDDEGNATYLR